MKNTPNTPGPAPDVHCAHDRLSAPADLRPNPRNPNRHPASQIKLLAKSERTLLDEAKEKPSRLGIAKNVKAASTMTGIPVDAIRAAKDAAAAIDGKQVWRQNGNIDCDLLVTWMAEHQEILHQFSDVPNIEIEKALLVKARRLDMEQRTAIRGKHLVETHVVKRDVGKMILVAKGMLMTNIDSITAGAAMKCALSPQQIADLRQIVSDGTLMVLRELAKGEWK